MSASPCPHCGAPVDEVQRYCLTCGEACNDESARLLTLAGGATGGASLPPSESEAPLVVPVRDEAPAAAPVPLRNDRRALTSFALAAAGALLLLITGWGSDTAQTLASALPPGLSVTYPGGAGPVAIAAAGDVAGNDDVPADDPIVDDTVVDDAPVDDTVVDDTVTDDTTPDDTTTDTPDDPGPDTTPTDDEAAPPPIKHVFVVVVPGQDVAAAAQTPATAPYLSKTLAPKGTILSGYRGVAAGGLPNRVALISGQGPTPEIVAGCPTYTDVAPGKIGNDDQELGTGCAFSVQTGTLGDQLASTGATWRAYTPDPAGTGCVDATSGARTAAPAGAPADPFASFHTATDSADCPKLLATLDALDADLAAGTAAPALAYIQGPAALAAPAAPAAGSRAETTTTTTSTTTTSTTTTPADPAATPDPAVATTAADAWLGTIVPKILKSKAYADDGLLVVTSDATAVNGADDPACCRPKSYPNVKAAGEGGRVGALLVSPYVAQGKLVDTSYSHFTLLRSIEDIFSLAPLGYAGLKSVGSLVPDVIESTKP